MLKSRSNFPPGGFIFYQPQTNWKPMEGLAFEQVVDAIIAHRLANPRFASEWSTDWQAVANELDAYTCRRITHNPVYCTGGGGDPKSPGASSLPREKESAAGAVKKFVANTAAGIGLYIEWFGMGKAETKEVAQARAARCMTCPKREPADIMHRWSQEVSRELLAVFGILKQLDLKLDGAEQLGVCQPCDCPLAAKVFAPKEITLKHIRPEAKAALWEKCWLIEK